MSVPPVPSKPPLTFGRRIVAAIGVIIMLLAGACSLFFTASSGSESSFYSTVFPLMLIFGGIPFGVGLVIFLLATKAGR